MCLKVVTNCQYKPVKLEAYPTAMVHTNFEPNITSCFKPIRLAGTGCSIGIFAKTSMEREEFCRRNLGPAKYFDKRLKICYSKGKIKMRKIQWDEIVYRFNDEGLIKYLLKSMRSMASFSSGSQSFAITLRRMPRGLEIFV